MPSKKRSNSRHKAKAIALVSKAKQLELLKKQKKFTLLSSILFIALAIIFFLLEGTSIFFWLTFVIGALILLPNYLLSLKKFSQPMSTPIILNMVRTNWSINFIKALSKHGKFFEKISILGLFIGFGLTGVDFWVARSQSKPKRLIILSIFAIGLAGFFWVFLKFFFTVPLLEPLLLLCMIAFIVLGMGGFSLALLVGYGFLSIFALFSAKQICPSVAPVIPGVPIPGLGTIIPLIAWISLGIIMILHEFSHGVLLAYYKQKIKSVGLLLAGIFPVGAFVEQNDKTFDTMNERKRVLILSAGPSINLLTIPLALIMILLFGLMLQPFAGVLNAETNKAYSGVSVNRVDENIEFCALTKSNPNYGKLVAGDIIKKVNGQDVNNISSMVLLMQKRETKLVEVEREGNIVSAEIEPVIFEDMNYARFGAEFEAIKTSYSPQWFYFPSIVLINAIESILTFLLILTFAVGMFNFMPVWILDGGIMAKAILRPYFSFMKFDSKKETEKFIGRLFLWIFIISILLNLLPYVTMIFL